MQNKSRLHSDSILQTAALSLLTANDIVTWLHFLNSFNVLEFMFAVDTERSSGMIEPHP